MTPGPPEHTGPPHLVQGRKPLTLFLSCFWISLKARLLTVPSGGDIFGHSLTQGSKQKALGLASSGLEEREVCGAHSSPPFPE